MGFFNRNKDETEEYIEQTVDQPVSAPAVPSVDGVLPPGVQPQPAPISHNLASQTAPPTTTMVAPEPASFNEPVVPPTTVAAVTTDDDSDGNGGYIMTAPPMGQQPDETDVQSEPTTYDYEPETHTIEPAYEDMEPTIIETAIVEEPAATEQPSMPVLEPASEPQQDMATAPAVSSGSDTNGDMADIKQKALRELSPLVEHLDQSPEEKFHTTMMLLQSTDDQSLIKSAYDAAQAITDDKTRAQALLDVVNEINYFSQKNN